MQNPRSWIISAIVALLGLCTPCNADTVSRIDLRREGQQQIDHYVVICARESESWGTGHTFVVWVEEDRARNEVHSQAFGFYPKVERVVGRLFNGDGTVRDESTRPASTKPWLLTHRMIVQVDRDAYEAALNVKQQWVGSGIEFQLLRRNCTHFAHEVMKAIAVGAPKPDLGERPSAYVGRIMKLDLGRTRVAQERRPSSFIGARR